MSTNSRCNRSRAIAFGRNYYHALGGTSHSRWVVDEQSELDVYQWDEPPWAKTFPEDEIQEVECSTQSTIFLTSSGLVYQTGTLHGHVNPSPTRLKIPLPLKCVQISAGRHFCLGLMEGGHAVVSWGAGHFGQLGVGPVEGDSHITFTSQPIVIERLLPHMIGSPVQQVAAGDWHALALTKSGRVWAWGSNRSQQCGRKPSSRNNSSQTPTVTVPLPVPLDISVCKISAGRSHSVAIAAETGQVYCWGGSNHGQCGKIVRRTGISPPRLLEGLADLKIVEISAGGNHTLAVSSGGRVFSWGGGCDGELGYGPAVSSQPRPRVVGDLDFVAIAAGQEWKNQQKMGVASDTSATSTNSSASHYLSTIPRITKVFAGPSYSVAISSSGHVYSWGSNDALQLGLPRPKSIPFREMNEFGNSPPTTTLRELHVRTFDSRHNVLLPTRITVASDLNARLIACGPNHMWCIGEERTSGDQIVGRTLYEVQEDGRQKKLIKSRNSLLSARSVTSAECYGTSQIPDVVSHSQTATARNILLTPENCASESFLDATQSRGIGFKPEVSPGRMVVSDNIDESTEVSAATTNSAALPHSGEASNSTETSVLPVNPNLGRRQGLIRRFSLSRLLRRRHSSRSIVDEGTGAESRTSRRRNSGNSRRHKG